MIYFDPKYVIDFDTDSPATDRLLIFHVFNYRETYHVRDVLIWDMCLKSYTKETINQGKESDFDKISFPDFSPNRQKVPFSTYVPPPPNTPLPPVVATAPKKDKNCALM